MKVAYISDLHLEFCRFLIEGLYRGDAVHLLPWLGFPAPGKLEADVLILAGDIHPDPNVRTAFEAVLRAAYGVPIITALGNHDYWGGPAPSDFVGDIQVVAGKTIASCTLWTWLSPFDEMQAMKFNDFLNIKGMRADHWNALNHAHKKFLVQAQADIIVTHHAPSHLSISPKFLGNPINGFFVNDIDFRHFDKTAVWIHGHVHSEHDYRVAKNSVDEIRVCANPYGYPWETERYGTALKIIDV